MARLPWQRPQRPRFYSDRKRFLTAAAAAEGGTNGAAPSGPGMKAEGWQSRAFGYYDIIGECWSPAQFYARGMAKIRYFPARKGADGKLEEITSGPAVDALDKISHVAPDYGRLLFLVGEGRLCQSRPPEKIDPDSATQPPVWEFLSPTEVLVKNNGRTIERQDPTAEGNKVDYDNISNDPDRNDDPAPGEMRMWRFWRKHPKNSMLADSPIRANLDIYEQLWWLTMRERAELQSRIADVGLLLIPDEIDFEPDGDAEEEAKQGDDPEVDPFQAYVGEMMMAAIREPGTAPAAIPAVIRGPAEYLEEKVFRVLHTRNPDASTFTSEREAALVRRLAVNLDMPPAALTGIGTMNHWNAWKNEDEKWQHIEPVAQMFATDVAASFLRPLLVAGGSNAAEVDEIYVGYDNSEFLRDPDRGTTAITLHKEGLLAGEKVLEANGWGADDEQSDEEHQEFLAIALKDASLVGGTPDGGAPQDEEQPPAAEPAAPDGDASMEALRARAEGYAVRRARAAAGAALRSARRSCPDCFEGSNGIPSEDLVAWLGRDKVTSITTEERVVQIMAGTYAETMAGLGWEPTLTSSHFATGLYAGGGDAVES